MPFTKVYIHFVWTTKNRIPFLDTFQLRQCLWNHIKQNAVQKGIYIDRINGYREHCHCLISLGIDQCMSNVMRLLKGESAHWMNKHQLCKHKFAWQDEYYGISVSQSGLDNVRAYIENQEYHHAKKTFQQEFDEFVELYDFVSSKA
jgi:putative transposase